MRNSLVLGGYLFTSELAVGVVEVDGEAEAACKWAKSWLGSKKEGRGVGAICKAVLIFSWPQCSVSE